MPAKIPWTEKDKYNSIMFPLREKYGVKAAPAMPCIAYDLPDEYLDSEGEPTELSPKDRYDLFNKLWRKNKRRKNQIIKSPGLPSLPPVMHQGMQIITQHV